MVRAHSTNVALVGYRGTGKSTVARLLALRLGWDWVDADVEIELRAAKSIAAMFADEGETAFRDLESVVVADLTRRKQTVIALGGGAVLREENRSAICECFVVWLRASVDAIVARLDADATTAARRPNLTIAGGRAEVAALLAEREPIYRRLARAVVDTDDKTPAEVAEAIYAQLPPTTGPTETA
ncbi:MAG: shikimate kinase [Pirellulales bacterium]